MKRVLMLASVASMIDQFNMPNIALLQKLGYEVDVACNFIEGNTCSDARVAELKQKLQDMHVHCYQIDFARNIKHMGQNMKALWQVEGLMKQNTYAFCHCHSPIGGVVARIAGHRTRTKVIYTAHGFHFYQGAPVMNWLVYYPVEKVLSRWTDVLITINHEDYARAKKEISCWKNLLSARNRNQPGAIPCGRYTNNPAETAGTWIAAGRCVFAVCGRTQ